MLGAYYLSVKLLFQHHYARGMIGMQGIRWLETYTYSDYTAADFG